MSPTMHTLHAQAEPMLRAATDSPDAAGLRWRSLYAVARLHDDAIERCDLEAAVDAQAEGLGRVVLSLDLMDVTGDVLARLGRHIESLDAGRRTEQGLQTLRHGGGETN